MRLQFEIIKKSNDNSICASHAPLEKSGILTTWPTAFTNSGNIVQVTFLHDDMPLVPPTVTSIGLDFRAMYTGVDDRQDYADKKYGVHSIQHARLTVKNVTICIHYTLFSVYRA